MRLIGSLRHLAYELTELVSVDLLLLLLRLWGVVLGLRLLQARARVLTRLFVRIRRLRRLVVNVDAGCSASPACRLLTVTRLRRLHLLLVIHAMRVGLRAPAMVLLLLRGAHVDVLLVGQLLLRTVQAATGCACCILLLLLAELLGGLFEIVLSLMQVLLLVIIVLLLMVHVLSWLVLLRLVELLHVILAGCSTAVRIVVLQVLIVVARVLSALRCLIIDYIEIAALLAGPVLQLYFDLGNAVLTSLGSRYRAPSFLVIRGRMVLWMVLLLILMV